jgi:hypothetical protein
MTTDSTQFDLSNADDPTNGWILCASILIGLPLGLAEVIYRMIYG